MNHPVEAPSLGNWTLLIDARGTETRGKAQLPSWSGSPEFASPLPQVESSVRILGSGRGLPGRCPYLGFQFAVLRAQA
jgi:hypothetical protein